MTITMLALDRRCRCGRLLGPREMMCDFCSVEIIARCGHPRMALDHDESAGSLDDGISAGDRS